MPEPLKFYSYARSAAADKAESVVDGRLKGTLKLTASSQNDKHEESISFEFLGPRDVLRLLPGAIGRHYPLPGATDVDASHCAYVEFSDTDVPWRYTLRKDGPTALKPWLALIVGTSEEISILPGRRAELRGTVLATHDLRHAARWAHVQRDEHDIEVTRLLSPRDLSAEKAVWRALLVPVYKDNGDLQWTPGTQTVTVPIHSWWSFQTIEKLGFVELANRLAPEPPPPGLGYAPLAYQMASADEVKPPMTIAGAVIKTVPKNGPDPRREPIPTEPDDIKGHFQELLEGGDLPRDAAGRPVDQKGRPVVKLPVYGEPWIAADSPQPQWAVELNSDPRLRGTAGLGAWAAIEWQEKIAGAALKQAGSLAVAAQRLRSLVLGLDASRRLWDARLAPAPLEERVMILGLAMPRMATKQGATLLEHVTASDRPLPPALFSSAARRLLRPRGPIGRQAAEGAMQPAEWLKVLNDCLQFAGPKPPADGLPHVDFLDFPDLDILIAEFLAQFGGNPDEATERFNLDSALEAIQQIWDKENALLGREPDEYSAAQLREQLITELSIVDLLREATVNEPDFSCPDRKVDLAALDDRLVTAMDPNSERPFIVGRVLGTIEGLDDQPLTPPELCLDFHLPAWQFLRDFDEDWILPGFDRLVAYLRDGNGKALLDEAGEKQIDPAKDPVVAAATNDLFTDAFMVGFNQQALQELRWRNIPIQSGCTPLRRFWEPIGVRPDQPPHPNAGKLDTLEDINGIHLWGDTPLGDDSHETTGVRGDNLILLFKTPLFRRFPKTLVYLAPRQAADDEWKGPPDWQKPRLEPNVQALIGKDAALFGFSEAPEVLGDHWLIVEQIPQGFNFYNRSEVVPDAVRQQAYGTAVDGGSFASAAFANPVRVLIKGPEMIAKENL